MDFPVFGQNPAALQVASASVPPAAQTAPQGGQQVAGSQTADATARPSEPMGFLDLVRATQQQYIDPNHKPQSLEKALFGENGFGIDDVIAAINPLQQLPIISTIYRAITGDTIDVGPRLVGGAIYGGVIGFVSAAIDAAVEGSTGHDIGGNVMSALFGAPDKPDNAPREPVMFSKADDNASQQADSSSASNPASASSAFGTPWYLANIVPPEISPQGTPKTSTDQNPTTAVAGVAASPATASAASATTAPQTQQAPLQAVSVASANSSGANTPGIKAPLHPLTPAQQALLNERDDDKNVAAVAPAAGSPSKAIDLSPEQEKLLLQSVGLAPKTPTTQPPVNQPPGNPPPSDQISANPVPAIVSTPAALAIPATPAGSITPQSVESNSVTDSAAKAIGTTPVPPGPILHAGGLKPAGELGSHPNGVFAQRMKYGLDKYLATPMPLNNQPPHLDVIQ